MKKGFFQIALLKYRLYYYYVENVFAFPRSKNVLEFYHRALMCCITSQNCIVSLEQSSLAKPESNRPKRIRPFDELPWKFLLSSSNVCAMLASFSSSSPSSSSCMRQKLSDKFFFGYLRSTRNGVLSLLRIDTSIDMLHGLNSQGLNFWIGLSSPNRSIEVELTLNFALFKTSEAASWSQIFRSGVRGGGESETVATAHGDLSWISGLSACWMNSFLRSVLMFIIELLPAARSLVLAISSWSLSVNMLYFLSIASTSRGNSGGRVSWVWHAISFFVTALAVDNATSVSMCSSRRTIFCLRSQQSWGDGTENHIWNAEYFSMWLDAILPLMFSLKNVFIAAWACDSNTGSNFSSNWALCGRMFWGRRQLMSSIDQTNSSLHSSLGVDTWKRLGLEINGRCSLSWSCDSNGFRTDLALWLIDGLWLEANDEVLCESRIYFAIFFGVVVAAGVRIVRDGTSRWWSVLTGVCSIWDGDRRELKVERVKRNIESWRFVVDQLRRYRTVKRNGKSSQRSILATL